MNLLQLDHLDENEKQSAIKMVAENQDRFHLKGEKLGHAYGFMHSINTITDKPVKVKNYRCPMHLKKVIDDEIQELLAHIIVR